MTCHMSYANFILRSSVAPRLIAQRRQRFLFEITFNVPCPFAL